MNGIIFEVKSRVDRPLMRIINAQAKNPDRHVTIYLDNESGRPMYPIKIESIMSGITITLDSDSNADCSLPPVIPESMVDMLAEQLGTVHDNVSAVRRLIKEEQKLFDNARDG